MFITTKASFQIKLPGAIFNLSIANVSIFRCHLKDSTQLDFAVSESVLNKTHQALNEKYKTMRCYFYINAEPLGVELGKYLYINENEVPKELMTFNQ